TTNTSHVGFDQRLHEVAPSRHRGHAADNYGYAGWHEAISSILVGDAMTAESVSAIVWHRASSKAQQTVLVACPEIEGARESLGGLAMEKYPGKTLKKAIEILTEISRKITIEIQTAQLLYMYRAAPLSMSYSAAAGATLLVLVTGFYALLVNGASHSSSFSGILCTTSNPKLDILAEGHCLGSQPLSNDLGSQRLQYGPSKSDNEGVRVRHAAFGTAGSVITLKKSMGHIK
ncbi:hypothetical protein DER46DRAFT_676147, partial [Fusarium sp. MPI-SDFR-AT-0072]